MTVDAKQSIEIFKTIIFVGGCAGAFVGAAGAAAYVSIRKRLNTVHVQLTDTQNGSFRGEFRRSLAEVLKRIDRNRESSDERFTNIDDRFGGLDRRVEGLDRRFEVQEGRLADIEEAHALTIDQQNMVLAQLDELKKGRAPEPKSDKRKPKPTV